MIPGSANFAGTDEAQRNAIVQALLAQQGAPATMYGDSVANDPYAYPTDPSDPATEGDIASEGPTGILGGSYGQGLGAIVGGDMGMSMAQQSTGNVQNAEPGTGLGLATPGYGSNLGHAHAASMADQAMTSLGIMDAIDTSIAVNNAVNEMGYNTDPSPAPDPGYTSPDPSSTIVGLPSDFTTSNASLSDTTGTGFDAGAAIAADVAGSLSDMSAAVSDAVAGYDSSAGEGSEGGGGSGSGSGGDGGK